MVTVIDSEGKTHQVEFDDRLTEVTKDMLRGLRGPMYLYCLAYIEYLEKKISKLENQ